MISVKDRIPLYPGRVNLNPVAGQANKYDMTRADDPTEAGTALNRRTMQLLQADIRTLPVAAGQTITAKQVVNVVSGAVTKAGTPSQAIALQSGTAGQSIDIIFDGVAELSGITAGTQITSAGVQGYAPQDGWLWVRPSWENNYNQKIPRVVVGKYTGNGVGPGPATQTINIGFTPIAVIVSLTGTGFSRPTSGGSGYSRIEGGVAVTGGTATVDGVSTPAVQIVSNGFQVGVDSQYSNNIYTNTSGKIFNYIAWGAPV